MRASRRSFTGLAGTACVLAVLCAMLAVGRTEDAAAPARPLRLAVVDLERVLEQSEQWQDHEEQLGRLGETMRRTLSKYDYQIRILRSEYADMAPGTDAAAEKVRLIEATMLEFRKARDSFDEQLDTQRRESLSAMFNKIAEMLEQYAKANDIDLILKKQDLRVSSNKPTELGVVVAATDVLYVSDQFDVTDAVVEQLNAQYPGQIRER